MNPLRTRTFTALAAIAAAACLLLAACGGDDDSDSSATPTAVVSGSATQDANAEQQLRDLAGKWGEATTKITYSLASASGVLTNESEVTIYRQPPNSRIDNAGTGGINSIISKPGLGYSCLDTNQSCALLTPEEAKASAEFVPFVDVLADSAGLDALVAGSSTLVSAPERTIAGEQTSCIRAGGDLAGIAGEATFCFTAEGLLLSIDFKGGAQTFALTATAIGEPEDADFDPPYAVATIPPSASPSAAP